MSQPAATETHGFVRGLNLFDSTMIVIGTMIGSGIFIVSADMARLIGSPGWLLAAWALTGILTVSAALSYGELAAMLPPSTCSCARRTRRCGDSFTAGLCLQ
jgi:APA family basic amino acid/polyamine antiporter